MTTSILRVGKLGSPWETLDPFLVCAHHVDNYPAGNSDLGPNASLSGRVPGRDVAGLDGWRMYFGRTVPGFVAHPHRGFETITVLRKGVIDHSDSHGGRARFGAGDVQWLTAGRGVVHAEMFPLLDPGKPNPLELFQIWLNLPARSKLVDPGFRMYWADDIPQHTGTDSNGRTTEVICVAGRVPGIAAESAIRPPADSWAADPDSDVAIWTVKMAPGAEWTLPPAALKGTRRQLFFFRGTTLAVDGEVVDGQSQVEVRCDSAVTLVNGPEPGEFLMLQGRPIGEPVVRDGLFVMNSEDELRQAGSDFKRTGFGTWPWAGNGPVHGPERGRFASFEKGGSVPG